MPLFDAWQTQCDAGNERYELETFLVNGSLVEL